MKKSFHKNVGWMILMILLIFPLSAGIVFAEDEAVDEPVVNSETFIPTEEMEMVDFSMGQITGIEQAGTEHHNHDISINN